MVLLSEPGKDGKHWSATSSIMCWNVYSKGELPNVFVCRRYYMHVSASWGAPVDWKTAEVVENKKAAEQ
jgi:hypothetical protein